MRIYTKSILLGLAKGINNVAENLTIFWFCDWKYYNIQFVSISQENGAQPTDAIYKLASHTRSVLAAIQYDSVWRNMLSLAKRDLWWEFISICHHVNGVFLSVSTGCIFHNSLCTVTFLHTKPVSTETIRNRCLSDSNDKRDALYYTYRAVGEGSAMNWLVTLLEQQKVAVVSLSLVSLQHYTSCLESNALRKRTAHSNTPRTRTAHSNTPRTRTAHSNIPRTRTAHSNTLRTRTAHSNALRTRIAHSNCTYPSYVQFPYCLWRHAGCRKLFDSSIPNSVSVTLLVAASGIIYKSVFRIYRRCLCLSFSCTADDRNWTAFCELCTVCWQQGGFGGWGVATDRQSCIVVVTAVCDNHVLLLRQSVTIMYCYGSLWQSCIVVVTAVCDNHVLLLRQSVTIMHCCCYGSLWQSCIVVTAVCDNHALLLLRQSVTIMYCCCYGSLSAAQFLYNCKRFLALTETVCFRLQFCNGTDGQSADALQYTFCVPVTVQSVESGSGVTQ